MAVRQDSELLNLTEVGGHHLTPSHEGLACNRIGLPRLQSLIPLNCDLVMLRKRY